MNDDRRDNSPAERIVRRYFDEVVDGRSTDAISEIFHPDCRIHRADMQQRLHGPDQVRRFVELSILAVPRIATTILDLVSRGDDVAVRLRHEVTFGPVVLTPLGLCAAKGRQVTWEAMAFFKISDGRIREEYVIRDEIAILRQLGMIHGDVAREDST